MLAFEHVFLSYQSPVGSCGTKFARSTPSCPTAAYFVVSPTHRIVSPSNIQTPTRRPEAKALPSCADCVLDSGVVQPLLFLGADRKFFVFAYSASVGEC